MAKDPAVLFYTSDFLIGTTFFTNEEKGQYITLLCQQHQLGHMSEEHMIKTCGDIGSIVAKKFVRDKEGFFYNERMEKEILKRKDYSKSRSNNRKHKKHMINICKTYDKHMVNENENRNDIVDTTNTVNNTPICNSNTNMYIDINTAEVFEELWKKYPKKVEKKKALSEFNKSVKNNSDVEDIKKALENYLEMLRVEDWRKPKDACRWFRDDFWRSFIEQQNTSNKSEADIILEKYKKGNEL